MKTILRNFVSVLRRFKMAMLLNVFGLSIALQLYGDYDAGELRLHIRFLPAGS